MPKLKNNGFTLIEVMLVVTILAVGLVMVVRSYTSSLQAIKVAQNLAIANLLLEKKIWEWQEKKGRVEELSLEEEQGSFTLPFDGFNYGVSFIEQEDLPLEYEGRLYKGSFEVSWEQRKRRHTTSSVTSLRSKE
jgi:prepilin-type N-terminal cleavage/methylation domain-containing protein